MKSIRILSLALIGLCGLVVTPAHAHTKYKSQTRNNSAQFNSWSSDDCSYTSTSVWVFEQESRGGQSYAVDVVYVDYNSYNYCTGEQTYGWAGFDGTAFDIQKLKSASVDVTDQLYLTACHYTDGGGGGGTGGMGGFGGTGGVGGSAGVGGGAAGAAGGSADGGTGWGGGYVCEDSYVPLVIDLSWAASGPVYKDRYSSSSSSPNGTYRQRFTGQSVDATVTGALIIDGQDLPVAGGYGSLGYTQQGTFEMYH